CVFPLSVGRTLGPKLVPSARLGLFRKEALFHSLGSDIRGKAPEQLLYGKRAGAEVVGSYDAIRWVPEAEVVPPGIDLERYRQVPPSDRARPVVVHAPSRRARKGTAHILGACDGLDAERRRDERLPHQAA